MIFTDAEVMGVLGDGPYFHEQVDRSIMEGGDNGLSLSVKVCVTKIRWTVQKEELRMGESLNTWKS